MKQSGVLVFLILLVAMPAWAQDYPKAEVFAGFSYLNVDVFGLARESFFGFQGSVAGNVNSSFGIIGDFGVQFRDFAGVGVSTYEFMGGPRFNARGEKATGFVHALFGGATISGGGGSETGFAMGFGGGADINATKRAAFRFQFDYIPARIAGFWTQNIRLGGGIVFKLGGS